MINMKNMIIFEPPMCCSTGICGPGVDKELLRVSTLINKLILKGIVIERYNLSQNPSAFVNNKMISELLHAKGADVLPVTIVNDEIVKQSSYLTNEEFLDYLNITIETLNEESLVNSKSSGCCCDGKCC